MRKKDNIGRLLVLMQLCSFGCFAQIATDKLQANAGIEATQWQRLRMQTLDQKMFKVSSLQKRLTAIVFFSPECPLCQNYTLVLNKLQSGYRKDLDIVGVFPGKSYSPAVYKGFGDKYHIQFLLLTDGNKDLVKLLHGRITPEVFLLDKERNILYQGAIDNWVTSLGKQRNKITENYLEDAIADCLNGHTVRVKEVKAIGCFINDR